MRFFKILVAVLFLVTSVFTIYVRLSTDTDYSAPEIKCDREVIELSVKDDTDILLDYVTATDTKDGDLTDKVIIESIAAFVKDNYSKVTYAVCDSDNNVTKLEVDIVFTDYVKPVFEIHSPQVYYTGAQKADLLSGVSAYDSIEGDISSRVTVSKAELDLSQPGVYPVTYRVTTEKGVASEITVNAYVYESRLSNSIELSEYLVYTDKNKKIDPSSYIESYPEEFLQDDYFSGYECSLDIIDEVNYSQPGTYYITYRLTKNAVRNVTDSDILAETYLAVIVRGEK